VSVPVLLIRFTVELPGALAVAASNTAGARDNSRTGTPY
jgi:hypothetical protein